MEDRIASHVFRERIDGIGPSHEELPPKEAARACLVAGEQMQNSGQVEQAIALYEKARQQRPGPEDDRPSPRRAL